MPQPLQAERSIDVLCVGYACVDLNFRVSHHPTEDEKIRARSMHLCGGGPAANAAVAISRLGGRAAFAGYLGTDAFGESHLREFVDEGVDTRLIKRGNAPTPVASVSIKPNGDRSIVDFRDPQALVDQLDFSLKELRPKVVLFDGHQPLLSTKILEEARELGIPTILDAGSVHDGTLMLYNRVEYLIASEKFAKNFSQEDTPRLALASMDGAATFVAVTWGSDGVYWQDDNGQHHTTAFDIEPVDTTGAGDAFHGAFALGIVRSLSDRDKVKMASATGALTCLRVGARNALPYRASVEHLSRISLSNT